MARFIAIIVFTLVSLSIFSGPLRAEETLTTDEFKPSYSNPHLDPIRVKLEDLAKKIPANDFQHLYRIRQSYGIIQSVEIVMKDVARAIAACSGENPSLETGIKARHTQWKTNIMPIVKASSDKLERVIDGQKFIAPQEIREYLGLVKVAADYKETIIDKEPVTSERACRNLIESMNDTEKNLSELLERNVLAKLSIPETKDSAEESKN